MKVADRIAAIILALFSLAMLYQASQMKSLPYELVSNSLFPNIVFGLILVLSIVLFLQSFSKNAKATTREYWLQFVSFRRIVILVLFTVYLLLLPVLGFMVATALFVIAASTVFAPNWRRGLPISLAIAAGLLAVIYGLFVIWLQVFLP